VPAFKVLFPLNSEPQSRHATITVKGHSTTITACLLLYPSYADTAMNSDNLVRFAGRIINYIRDPMPTNAHNDAIWCLGQRYDSFPESPPPGSTQPQSSLPSALTSTRTTEAAPSDSTTTPPQKEDEFETIQVQDAINDKAWPSAFLDDVESRIWLTYRSNFSQIAKSSDPDASSSLSFRTRLLQLGNQGFTSDTGWGCMIRSAQSLLANTLQILELGRDWRKGQQIETERRLLSLFADDPSAPFSIHSFVKHGSEACGKHPGEWFGPSAAARCIKYASVSSPPFQLTFADHQ
jgi:cysteine protease ATG4